LLSFFNKRNTILFYFIVAIFISLSFNSSYAARTDNIKVFFNDPPDTKNIDIELANFIDSAKVCVIAHFYQINRQCVVNALINAAKRLGPKNIKLITDNKYYKNKKYLSTYSRLESAGIVIRTDQSDGSKGTGESHNKFCVVDSKKVWTGSYNPTDNNSVNDYNNALILNSTDAAILYSEEFSNMYDKLLFGSNKPRLKNNHKFTIDSVEVEVYFSPADNVNGIICDYILKAKSFISFVIFAFTYDEIENALFSKHSLGVNVRGMCDDLSAGGKSSGYTALVSKKMNVKKDSNSRSQLHDKFIVFDHESNTAAVITGSHNYTKAANTKNDENIVIIHDKYYSQLYYNEFAKIYGAKQIKIEDNLLNIITPIKK